MAQDERQDSWPNFERSLTRRDLLKRGGATALTLSAGSSLLAACGGGGGGGGAGGKAAEKAKTARDTLVVAVEGDIDTFDPAFTVGSKPAQTTIQNSFDQLTQYKQVQKKTDDGKPYQTVDTEQIVGMLAENFDEKGSSVVFTLRDGARYHDGTPVTAKEIENGYRRVYEAEGISYFLLTMAAVSKPDMIRARGGKNVDIRMGKRNLLLMKNNTMHNTSAISIEDVKAHSTSKDPWATEYFKKHLATGNGPFRMTDYRPGDRIVLEAVPGYYGGGDVPGKPKLKRVIQKIVPEATQRVLLLKRGEVDMMMIPPVKELDALEEDPSLEVLSFPNPRNFMLEMNTKIPPFDKKEVRQAVSYAVPYETIVNEVLNGYGRQLTSPIPDGTPTHTDEFFVYKQDPEKAKQLLAEAGFPNGFETTLAVASGNQEGKETAVWVQQSLAEIGVKVNIQELPGAAFTEQLQKHELGFFFFNNWISINNDPFYHLYWLFWSPCCNYTNYSNPEVHRLIEQFTLSTDQTAREQATLDAQRMIVDDAPWVFLYQPDFLLAMWSNVKGYIFYSTDRFSRYKFLYKE